MAKKGEVSIFNLQKSSKPSINDTIQTICDGDLSKQMNRLVDYFKQNKMSPGWYATNSYNVNYKGKRVCRLTFGRGGRFEKNHVLVFVYPSDYNIVESFFSKQSDDVKEAFINNMKYCTHCGSCKPGKEITVLGNTYKNVCQLYGIGTFYSPSKNQIEFIKDLIHIRREFIKNGLA